MYIGLMSGTSIDAIDCVLITIQNEQPRLLAASTTEIPVDIRNNLFTLIQSIHCDIGLLGKTDTQLGQLFAKACLDLLKKTNVAKNEIIAIGSHGQTIYHQPNHDHPFTMQIGDPNIIAAKTGITTVADFRRRDLALGGQAAPLAPAFHAYLFGRQSFHQWVVNIGGMANITGLSVDPATPVIGFDTGPGNTLLDQWHQQHHQAPMDVDGRWARSGTVHHALLKALLADPYFQKPPPKSTGRDYFHLSWLVKHLASEIKPVDVQATLTELTAITIANAINAQKNTEVIWICGGGAFNQYLMERLIKHCAPATVKTTSDIGIDPKWIEAAAFAWLAKQTIEKKPGNLPSVTGAKSASILGAIFPV